jgi:hypothetical protein
VLNRHAIAERRDYFARKRRIISDAERCGLMITAQLD